MRRSSRGIVSCWVGNRRKIFHSSLGSSISIPLMKIPPPLLGTKIEFKEAFDVRARTFSSLSESPCDHFGWLFQASTRNLLSIFTLTAVSTDPKLQPCPRPIQLDLFFLLPSDVQPCFLPFLHFRAVNQCFLLFCSLIIGSILFHFLGWGFQCELLQEPWIHDVWIFGQIG